MSNQPEKNSEPKDQSEAAAPAAGAPQDKTAPATFRSILGKKKGMTQIFAKSAEHLFGVTVVEAGPCPVLRVKTADGPDGYNAVQIGFGSRKEKHVSKAVLGQFKKAGAPAGRWVREIRVKDTKGLEQGQTVLVDRIFKAGDFVDVQGISKGKGFAGVMKRHNFAGLPASHGASDKERSPGALAARRSLGRVLPGQRMAGRLGGDKTSSMKIQVIKVDAEKNLIYLNGPVPGVDGGLVTIKETVKPRKAFVEVAKKAAKGKGFAAKVAKAKK